MRYDGRLISRRLLTMMVVLAAMTFLSAGGVANAFALRAAGRPKESRFTSPPVSAQRSAEVRFDRREAQAHSQSRFAQAFVKDTGAGKQAGAFTETAGVKETPSVRDDGQLKMSDPRAFNANSQNDGKGEDRASGAGGKTSVFSPGAQREY